MKNELLEIRADLIVRSKPCIVLLCALLVVFFSRSVDGQCHLDVGKNVMITGPELKEGRNVWETHIAANPRNRNNLVATGHSEGKNGAIYTVFYFSIDGGNSWVKTKILGHDGQPTSGLKGADPVVIFDKAGVAYLFTMGQPPFGNLVHVSRDGGRTAGRPQWINNLSIDHPMPAADHTDGRYGGRVYAFGMLWDLSVQNGRKLGMFRTSSAGTDWSAFEILNSKNSGLSKPGENLPDLGVNSNNNGLLISSTGKLYFFARSWNAKDSGRGWNFIFNTSDDGGNTYTAASEIKTANGASLIDSSNLLSFPAFGIDAKGRFKDRIYAAWVERRTERNAELLFSISGDQGKTWEPSRKVQIDRILDSVGRYSGYIHPSLTVNSEGNVLITFYAFRTLGEFGAPRPNDSLQIRIRPMSFRRYVTGSVDGGETFLPVEPLAAEDSPFTSKLLLFNNRETEAPDNSRHMRLNDYLNDTSGPDGTFHTQWMDRRTELQEMWYAPVRVMCGNKPRKGRRN